MVLMKGLIMAAIPNLEVTIKNQIFYHNDGFLYVATGDDSTLLRVNIDTGDTMRIYLPAKLLPTEDGLIKKWWILSYIQMDNTFIIFLQATVIIEISTF